MRSMYGTRDAAQNWEAAYTKFVTDCGFEVGTTTPCIFNHKERDLRAVIHGDDFAILGTEQEFKWLRDRTEATFDVKFRGRMGPDAGD